ncbi:hypothetical protein M501DRAFT_935940 [Patellaria atrata CBS 101060]|uniref:N-acetyltransferase domain-containing protein n=1 Tax=Patellaria atrata CBS 101060 TaxID=1346257 RepID=A0A9P4SAS4_9PEZI|nr:hypothetical protein M501DRAFT_935940 [Patellaria atrata CBS 101060]
MTRFKVEEVDPFTDLEELLDCQLTAFASPDQSIYRLFCPVFGNDKHAHKDAVKRKAEMYLKHYESSTEHDFVWSKVTDTENGKIAGGLMWNIFKTNPWKQKVDHINPDWYSEEREREFILKAMDIFNGPRKKYMQKPHVYLDTGFVHPEYRKNGIITMFLTHATKKADELGLEVWLESSVPMGVPIYMRCGFIPLQQQSIQPQTSNPDDAWKAMEEKLYPLKFWPMWRPLNGDYMEGMAHSPWANCSEYREKSNL